jgi:hypothetical protein
MGSINFIPFKIANGASKSSVIDLDPGNILVGIMIHGTWTAAKISFEGYVQDTATKTNPANPADPLETGALFDAIKDVNGNQATWGNGTDTSAQLLVLAPTLNLQAPRFIKVVSGTTAAPVVQNQAVSGFILCRFT